MSTKMKTENQLMLLQGISLIENGLTFLEYMNDMPNENAWDAMTILRDRFKFFKECALNEGECDLFLVRRMHELYDNVINDYERTEDIAERLNALRSSLLQKKVNS